MKKILLALIFISLFIPNCLEAENQPQNSIQIAPLKYEEKLNLGEVKIGTIDVINPTAIDEKIVVEVDSLKMSGLSGNLEFYKSKEGLEKYITFNEKQFVLPARSGKKVKFRIGMPISASPGGYYGAIFFRILPQDSETDQTRAITSGRVGTILLLSVGQGDVRLGRVGDLTMISNPFDAKTKLLFAQENIAKYNSDPRGLLLKPTGEIVIKNIFGKEVAKEKIKDIYVLPETRRDIQSEVEKANMFGLYKAELNISNYPGDPVETKKIYFVKISPNVLFIIGVFFLVSFIIISFIRRSKENIVNKKTPKNNR
jgi:hypothetical protein